MQDWHIYLNTANATLVSVNPNAPIKDFREFLAGKTATVRQGQEEIAVNVDVLIFAVGAKPDNRLQEELVSSGRSVVKVGDCIQPRNILESVREGFEAGNKID